MHITISAIIPHCYVRMSIYIAVWVASAIFNVYSIVRDTWYAVRGSMRHKMKDEPFLCIYSLSKNKFLLPLATMLYDAAGYIEYGIFFCSTLLLCVKIFANAFGLLAPSMESKCILYSHGVSITRYLRGRMFHLIHNGNFHFIAFNLIQEIQFLMKRFFFSFFSSSVCISLILFHSRIFLIHQWQSISRTISVIKTNIIDKYRFSNGEWEKSSAILVYGSLKSGKICNIQCTNFIYW